MFDQANSVATASRQITWANSWQRISPSVVAILLICPAYIAGTPHCRHDAVNELQVHTAASWSIGADQEFSLPMPSRAHPHDLCKKTGLNSFQAPYRTVSSPHKNYWFAATIFLVGHPKAPGSKVAATDARPSRSTIKNRADCTPFSCCEPFAHILL